MEEDRLVVMPSPDWNGVTLRWKGRLIDGAPATGRLIITSDSPRFLDDDAVQSESIIADGVSIIVPIVAGYAEIEVPATDDPDITPNGFTYTIVEQLDKGVGRTIVTDAPLEKAVDGIDLNRLVSIDPSPGTDLPPITRAELDALAYTFVRLDQQAIALDEDGTPYWADATDVGEDAMPVRIDSDGRPYVYVPDEGAPTIAYRDAPNGLAPLDSTGRVPQSNLPTHLDPIELSASYARKKRTDAQVAFNPPLLADPPPPPSPVVQTLNAFPASPVVPTVTEARTMVTFKGGVCELVNTTSSVNGATIQAWRNTQPIFQGASGQQSIFAVEFDIMDATNPLEVALRLRDNFSSNGCKLWTWVDGVPQTADYISCGVTPGGDNFNWHLNLGAGATGRRRVKVYLHNCDFSGLNLKATSLVQPTPSGELKFGFLADSWGAGANTVLPGRTYLRTAARLLGAEAYVEAQGGTGYVEHTTNPSLAAYGNRLTKLATSPIDYLVIAGSLNDDVNNDASPATIQAAAAACYASWATLRPDVPIIVVGVQSVGTAPSTGDSNADRIANNNAVKAAAAAAPNVLGFIDMLGEKWMTGTGYIGSTTGVGPSDWAMDSVYHPSVAGADMIAQRLATRITDILKAA